MASAVRVSICKKISEYESGVLSEVEFVIKYRKKKFDAVGFVLAILETKSVYSLSFSGGGPIIFTIKRDAHEEYLSEEMANVLDRFDIYVLFEFQSKIQQEQRLHKIMTETVKNIQQYPAFGTKYK